MKIAFRAFSILLIIQLLAVVTACTIEEAKQAERVKVYYLNEDFILVDKSETTTYDSDRNGSIKIRTWKLHRVNSPYDSIYVGEIISDVVENETQSGGCGCGSSNFYISNELWYNKEIGDVLHFDFIRKNRFYKVKKDKLIAPISSENQTVTPVQSVAETNVNGLEKERKVLEIERQILSLQRELETLKEN